MVVIHIIVVVVFIQGLDCVNYQLISTTNGITFDAAKHECDAMGYQLAVLKTSEQITNIENYLDKQNLVRDIWIGMWWDGTVEKFRWTDTNDTVAENVPWDDGEPNCMTPSSLPCYWTPLYQNCVRLTVTYAHVLKTHNCDRLYDALCQSFDATTTVETTTYSSTDKLVFESTTSETNLGITIPSTTLSSTTGKTSNGASTAEILSTTETASYDTTEKHSTKNTISKTTIFHLASYSSTKSPVVSQTTEPTHIPGTTSGATPQPSSNVSNHSCHSCSGACCVCSPVLNTTTTATSVDELKTSLTIDKTKTNSYIRKRTSAYDGRVSSMVIGYSGVLFLTVIFSFFVFFDLTNFAMYGYKKCKK